MFAGRFTRTLLCYPRGIALEFHHVDGRTAAHQLSELTRHNPARGHRLSRHFFLPSNQQNTGAPAKAPTDATEERVRRFSLELEAPFVCDRAIEARDDGCMTSIGRAGTLEEEGDIILAEDEEKAESGAENGL